MVRRETPIFILTPRGPGWKDMTYPKDEDRIKKTDDEKFIQKKAEERRQMLAKIRGEIPMEGDSLKGDYANR